MLSRKQYKSNILKTFNRQIQDFLKKLIEVLPKEDNIKTLNTMVNTFCKYNPVKLISIWHYYIALPYFNIISSGDIAYFENKNYSNDLVDLKGNAEYVLQCYNKVKISISKLDNKIKQSIMQYVQILTKLSKKYYE
jgi:hypothetical protein